MLGDTTTVTALLVYASSDTDAVQDRLECYFEPLSNCKYQSSLGYVSEATLHIDPTVPLELLLQMPFDICLLLLLLLAV